MVTTSGRPVGEDSAKYLLSKVGDTAEILALTFHPGKLCIDRGMAFDEGVKGKADIHVTYHEMVVPGQVQNGNALAQLADGQSGRRRQEARASGRAGTSRRRAPWRRSAGGRTDVVTSSINGSPQGVQMVKDGDMTATIWQPAYEEGKQVFQAILDADGRRRCLDAQDIDIPGVVVTKDNVDQFMADHPPSKAAHSPEPTQRHGGPPAADLRSLDANPRADKHFAGEIALRDIDLDIARGEIHGLVGANGAGKSTLIRCLAGVTLADRGRITVDGEELRKARRRRPSGRASRSSTRNSTSFPISAP